MAMVVRGEQSTGANASARHVFVPSGRPDPPAGVRRVRRLVLALVVTGFVATASTSLAVWQALVPSKVMSVVIEPSLESAVPTALPGLLAATEPSVVRVRAVVPASASGAQAASVSEGTGVVVTSAGRIVTDAHVVGLPGAALRVTLATSEVVPASLVALDPTDDLALLQIDQPVDLAPVTFADTAPTVGDPVVTIGFALGMSGSPTVSQGIISGADRTFSTERADGLPVTYEGLLQTDAPIASGQSGGPVLDPDGRVLGLVEGAAGSSQTTTAENVGFVIPSSTVEAALTRMVQAG